MKCEPVRYSTKSVSGESRRELQICRQANGRVPTMRDKPHAVLLGHPGNPPLFADAAHLRHIGLHDVEGALLEPGLETLLKRVSTSPPAMGSGARRRSCT